MDAETIAGVIARYLNDRDDVAEAAPSEDDPGVVSVETQGGELYTVTVVAFRG